MLGLALALAVTSVAAGGAASSSAAAASSSAAASETGPNRTVADIASTISRRRLQSATGLEDGLEFAPNEMVSLALSGDGVLALLTHISTAGATTPAGRSYDGFEWEGVQPLALQFDCTAMASCSANLPGAPGDTFRLDIHTAEQPATDAQAAARFLLHATFGPTISEVNDLTDGLDFASWIGNQMAIVRAHFMRTFTRRGHTDCMADRVRWMVRCSLRHYSAPL
jgi:hypothetical protein